MQIIVLCNAGVALDYDGATLLIDVPNGEIGPFAALKDDLWSDIQSRQGRDKNICGLFFTHEHPDHYDKGKVNDFSDRWPDVPVWLPGEGRDSGTVQVGPFLIAYKLVEHAPMDAPMPPHAVLLIKAGDCTVYIAGDAKLDVDAHGAFLGERCVDVAFWNSMYLSRPLTRALLTKTARKNYIYHMPENNPDGFGLWAKCEKNLQRFGEELKSVTVINRYPYVINE